MTGKSFPLVSWADVKRLAPLFLLSWCTRCRLPELSSGTENGLEHVWVEAMIGEFRVLTGYRLWSICRECSVWSSTQAWSPHLLTLTRYIFCSSCLKMLRYWQAGVDEVHHFVPHDCQGSRILESGLRKKNPKNFVRLLLGIRVG